MAYARAHPGEPAEDVEEAWAWCTSCGAQRRFVAATEDLARLEEAAPVPDVRRAIEGEQGWACEACGTFRHDLVVDESYNPEFANVAALRSEESEQRLHGEGVHDDLALRKASEGGAELHEPATEEGAGPSVRGAAPGDTLLQEARAEDPELERQVLEDVRRAEAGDVPLGLPHGPRRPMPPPARVPPRDPTGDD